MRIDYGYYSPMRAVLPLAGVEMRRLLIVQDGPGGFDLPACCGILVA
jgi:hypothetical protein